MADTLMSSEQAGNVRIASVQAPAFFNRLAALGITPRSEEEASHLWDLGVKSAALREARTKTAGDSRFAPLVAAVDQHLAQAGYQDPRAARAEAARLEKVAADAAVSDDVYNAYLVGMMHEAEAATAAVQAA